MKQIIVELPDNSDWITARLNDHEVMETILIDKKEFTVSRTVVLVIDYYSQQRDMWRRMYESHDKILNILFDERDKRDKGQLGLFSKV